MDGADRLFEFRLQRVLAAERRILEVLDDAAAEANDPSLRDALLHHRGETVEQVKRIESVFQAMGREARSVDPSVIEGLVEEKRRFMSEEPTPEMLDAYNVASGVTIENVEIAAYEELLTLAERLGVQEALDPLRANLREERAALEKLTQFAARAGQPAQPRSMVH